MKNTVTNIHNLPTLGNIELEHDAEHQAVWAHMTHPARPCITADLLRDLARIQQSIEPMARHQYESGQDDRLLYQVLVSDLPGVFNLGGDLALFSRLIEAKDRETLAKYAKACIDILYPCSIGYGLPFTTISLVQGEALGGGFEAALSSQVLIAERSAKFGFPETLFGLFPGMGAFSFLARRLSPAQAKRMIASGKVYSAEELYQLGLIDLLVPDGQGRQAVYNYMRHQHNRSAGHYGLQQAMDRVNPVSLRELFDIAEVWVDAAMRLSPKNLRVMQYLIQAQERRWGKPSGASRLQAVG